MGVATVLSFIALLLISVLSYAAFFWLVNRKTKPNTSPTTTSPPVTTSKGTTPKTSADKTRLDTVIWFAILFVVVAVLVLIGVRAHQVPWGEISGKQSMLYVGGWAWDNWRSIFSLLGLGFLVNWLCLLLRSNEKEEKERGEKIYKQVKTFLIGAMFVIFLGLPITGWIVNYVNPDPSQIPARCLPYDYQEHSCVVTAVWSRPFGLAPDVVIPTGEAPVPIARTVSNDKHIEARLVTGNLWQFKTVGGGVAEMRYHMPQ